MAEKEANRYPSNEAYMGPKSSSNRSPNARKEQSSADSLRASILAERVQELEDQVVSIATALNEDGRENQVWQEQLVKEHREASELLASREQQLCALEQDLAASEHEKHRLRDTLFQQNEHFERLHREVQEARAHGSRAAGRELEEKVLELNDQISTLLVKIQQMVQENNQLISYNEELERAVQQHKGSQDLYEAEIQRLNDSNNYLKEEIKEVQTLAIAQQTETQNSYLQQLQEANLHIQHLKAEIQHLKAEIQHLKAEQHQVTPLQHRITQVENQGHSRTFNKENCQLRAEVHSLEEELLQHRELQRSIKKKHEERLLAAQAENQKLADENLRLKTANRSLERLCSDQSFALQQGQVQSKNPEKAGLQSQQHYKNIIIRLQSQKQEMALKVAKSQIQSKYEHSTQFYSALLKESDMQLQRLRDELAVSDEQLGKSRRSVREFSQLAKRWEEDYRKLSQDYEDAFIARRRVEEQTKSEQVQLQKHKQRYEQLVRKCDQSSLQYKQLQEKLRCYQQSRAKPIYDKESSDLIRLQNSILRQEISQVKQEIAPLQLQITQLKQSLEQHSCQISREDLKLQEGYRRQMDSHKKRERQLQRLVQMLRNRLAAQSNSPKEPDLQKVRQLADQLARVNRMLNQRQQELDSFKNKYADLQSYLGKRQEAGVTKHHPQYTRLKNQFVSLQRKLMETELHYKNSLQNAEFEIQSLKVENLHHRKKIEDLLVELSSQRNSLDYNKIYRSFQLSQLKIKELEKELEVSQLRFQELNQQIRIKQLGARKASDNALTQKDYSLSQRKSSYKDMPHTDLQFQYSPKEQQRNKKEAIANQAQEVPPPAYEELLRWREEVKQSRTDFSKKWINQFSAEHCEIPGAQYPLKERIYS